MFSVQSSGWLSYTPFHHYRLPEIVYKPRPGEDDDGNPSRVEFIPKDNGEVAFTQTRYRLRWPGEQTEIRDDGIPVSIVQHWPSDSAKELMQDIEKAKTENTGKGLYEDIPLSSILKKNMLPPPDEIPEDIAYHLAVNHRLYFGNKGVRYPLAGLPARRVQQILNLTFALDEKHVSALRYLKWVSETHHRHPLLQGFDTNVRETLMGLSHKAAALFFYLICDCQYDEESHWWARHENRIPYQMPLYMHWIGRTGQGLYTGLAGIPPEVSKFRPESSWDICFPDVIDQLNRWDCDRMRHYMRDDGHDPCQAKGPVVWEHLEGE